MATTGYIETLSSDGDTSTVNVGGVVRVSLTGDFGSGTAKLQAQTPAGSFVDVNGASWTSATDTLVEFPPNSNNIVKINLASSTSPALVCWIQSSVDDAR